MWHTLQFQFILFDKLRFILYTQDVRTHSSRKIRSEFEFVRMLTKWIFTLCFRIHSCLEHILSFTDTDCCPSSHLYSPFFFRFHFVRQVYPWKLVEWNDGFHFSIFFANWPCFDDPFVSLEQNSSLLCVQSYRPDSKSLRHAVTIYRLNEHERNLRAWFCCTKFWVTLMPTQISIQFRTIAKIQTYEHRAKCSNKQNFADAWNSFILVCWMRTKTRKLGYTVCIKFIVEIHTVYFSQSGLNSKWHDAKPLFAVMRFRVIRSNSNRMQMPIQIVFELYVALVMADDVYRIDHVLRSTFHSAIMEISIR